MNKIIIGIIFGVILLFIPTQSFASTTIEPNFVPYNCLNPVAVAGVSGGDSEIIVIIQPCLDNIISHGWEYKRDTKEIYHEHYEKCLTFNYRHLFLKDCDDNDKKQMWTITSTGLIKSLDTDECINGQVKAAYMGNCDDEEANKWSLDQDSTMIIGDFKTYVRCFTINEHPNLEIQVITLESCLRFDVHNEWFYDKQTKQYTSVTNADLCLSTFTQKSNHMRILTVEECDKSLNQKWSLVGKYNLLASDEFNFDFMVYHFTKKVDPVYIDANKNEKCLSEPVDSDFTCSMFRAYDYVRDSDFDWQWDPNYGFDWIK